MKIGLALGGGGARGYAHIGVIRAMGDKGIRPDIIVGTSMGSIVGAMYAQTNDIKIVERRFREYIASEDFSKLSNSYLNNTSKEFSIFADYIKRTDDRIVLDLSISEIALFQQKFFMNTLDYLLTDGNIKDTKIKFGAVTADLISGKKVVLESGNIKKAVLASSSIPAVLPPVKYNSMLLVDGEAVEIIPSGSARELGADYVIAVDVRMSLQPNPPLENAIDIYFRANQVKSRNYSDKTLQAEIIITPDVGDFHWTRFEEFDTIVEAGYNAGMKKMEEIIRLI